MYWYFIINVLFKLKLKNETERDHSVFKSIFLKKIFLQSINYFKNGIYTFGK